MSLCGQHSSGSSNIMYMFPPRLGIQGIKKLPQTQLKSSIVPLNLTVGPRVVDTNQSLHNSFLPTVFSKIPLIFHTIIYPYKGRKSKSASNFFMQESGSISGSHGWDNPQLNPLGEIADSNHNRVTSIRGDRPQPCNSINTPTPEWGSTFFSRMQIWWFMESHPFFGTNHTISHMSKAIRL